MIDPNNLPELPRGWKWSHLENLTEILDNKRIPINADEREQRIGEIPYYGATGQVGWIDDYLFDDELVLLGEDGAPFLDFNKSKAYIIRGKSWVNNHAHVLKSSFGFFSNQLLCHYLNQFDYNGYISGTTRYKLNQAPMRKIPIPLPPLPEQHRIVAKIEELFTRLDDGIEALRKIRLQLKRYRQSVLKAAFEGQLTAEWRTAHKDELEPASALLDRIKAERKKKLGNKYKELPPVDTSELPGLPEGWEWARVGDVADKIQYGTSDKTDENTNGIPVIRMGNIQDGRIVFDNLKYLPENYPLISELLLQDGDLLFNRTNSAELVGKSAVYKKHYPSALFASYLIRVQTNKTYYVPDILSFLINSTFGRKYISSVVSQQVGQANVNGTKLSLMPIPILSLSEQQAMAEAMERCFSIADEMELAVEKSLKQSERLRQSILKQAFEGKLVPQDPNDEPAEKLLERIKAEKAKPAAHKRR